MNAPRNAKAPLNDADREVLMQLATTPTVSVEELLYWACIHVSQIQTQFSDQEKHWTVEDVLDMLALAIVKLRRRHPTLDDAVRRVDTPTRGLKERIEHFEKTI